jgi:hypothetical protein
MTDNSLIFLSKNGDEIEPDKKEALRYMGCRDNSIGDLEAVYEECLQEYKKVASYKAVYSFTDIMQSADNTTDMRFCKISNHALYKNLSGCESAAVFAATAGVGVDRLIMRYAKISPAYAVVTSCIASSAIEVWCDEVNALISESYETKPRFSPGYGGVSLEYQKDVLSYLDAERKIGITLSDALMMIPAKSVTAFVGIVKNKKSV